MTTEPHPSARTVSWIVDNGSSHAGKNRSARWRARGRTPASCTRRSHGSWLNHIEPHFSIVQRKAPTPNDFGCLDERAARRLAVAERHRRIARPLDRRRPRRLDRAPRAGQQPPSPPNQHHGTCGHVHQRGLAVGSAGACAGRAPRWISRRPGCPAGPRSRAGPGADRYRRPDSPAGPRSPAGPGADRRRPPTAPRRAPPRTTRRGPRVQSVQGRLLRP